jgi:hypothetical protein
MSHHNTPSELDVSSKSCDYDSRTGFAGDIGQDFYSVDYFYTLLADSSILGNTEILYNEPIDFDALPDNSIHNVVFQIEMGIGSYLLQESGEFQSAPCNMRRQRERQLLSSRRTQQSDLVRNVGLTIGPDDEIVATCESPNPGTACYWVAGSFQVYTMGPAGNTTVAQQNIQEDLKEAMNSGELNKVHSAILNITYMDALPGSTADEATSGQPDASTNNDRDTISSDENGPDAAIIVSASVGAVLLIAAIAVVTRRRNRHDEQTFFQASSMDVSEFHMSREESVVESSTQDAV